MKRRLLQLAALLLFANSVYAQIIDIPDANFKDALINDVVADFDGDNVADGDADTNDDGEIQLSEAEAVLGLNIRAKAISSLEGINAFVNLTFMEAGANDLTEIDISALNQLKDLEVEFNELESIVFPAVNAVENLDLDGNNFAEFNLSEIPNLASLSFNANPITTLDFSGLNNLEMLWIEETQLESLNLIDLPALEIVRASENLIETVIINNCPELNEIRLRDNLVSDLSLESLPNLLELWVNRNSLTNLDVTHLTSLEVLVAEFNNLESVNIAELANLEALTIGFNNLSSIDLSGLNQLQRIQIHDNPLDEISLETVPILDFLRIENTNLVEIDLSPVPELEQYLGGGDNITELDFSLNPNLIILGSNGSSIERINLKNGSALDFLSMSGSPNLEYICADEFEIDAINEFLEFSGLPDFVVNQYCSFDPGGDAFVIQGESRLDEDSDGCTPSDLIVPNMRLTIDNGTETGTYIANSSGNYAISVNEGDYELTPFLEFSDYYTIDPSSYTVNFPTDPSPVVQDICITPIPNVNDLEVVIIPLSAAVPGFDTEYRLLIRNNGTTTISGELEFTFEEPFMDYLTADVPPLGVTEGMISWEFSSIAPFEAFSYNVSFNLNTPTETPPLEAGEILNFIANLSFAGADETPDNNIFELTQEVVNAHDPNDKTALEGDKILEESVGEYMHYLIRFENLGTANAVNVVVTDTIDTSKFQLSSLVPLRGSHGFETRISENLVEFIFEGINLPFHDANNDGYVLFKIKTQETLELGDSFSNSAAIYFDFNPPIITNEAITTVVNTLGTDEFVLADTVQLYPNPALDILNVSGIPASDIELIQVYNLQGLLIAESERKTQIEVAQLQQGVFFLKIQTSDGQLFKKFLKK